MLDTQFQAFAENLFHFLVRDYGFIETTAELRLVTFVSPKVVVELSYSERDEVDAIIDQNPSTNRFQFRLFLDVFHPDVSKTMGDGIAFSDDAVRKELAHLSELLRQYGRPLLEGNPEVFNRIRKVKWWELPS